MCGICVGVCGGGVSVCGGGVYVYSGDVCSVGGRCGVGGVSAQCQWGVCAVM